MRWVVADVAVPLAVAVRRRVVRRRVVVVAVAVVVLTVPLVRIRQRLAALRWVARRVVADAAAVVVSPMARLRVAVATAVVGRRRVVRRRLVADAADCPLSCIKQAVPQYALTFYTNHL
jgi:hypothetical protein